MFWRGWYVTPKEEALHSLQSFTEQERSMVLRFARREIFCLTLEYDANRDNEDAIFQDAIDAQQRERQVLLRMYNALVVLVQPEE